LVTGAVLLPLVIAAQWVIPDPGSSPRKGPPPLSAIEPGGAQEFSARTHAPGQPAGGGAAQAEAAGAPAGAVSAPLFLDHVAVDLDARDRYGNPPRRDLTPDELTRIAAEYDIVIDNLEHQPDGVPLSDTDMATLRALNPRIKILRTLWTLSSNDGTLQGIEPGDGNHESWFLRDASGAFVRAYSAVAPWNGHVSYVLDPSSEQVRLQIAAQARIIRRLGYDGVVLDDVIPYVAAPDGSFSRKVLLSHPVSRTTERPYTDDEWRGAVLGLVAKVRQVTGPDAYIAVAGVGNGGDYLRSNASLLLDSVDAIVLRPFAGDGSAASDPATWSDDVEALAQISGAGKGVLAYGTGAPQPLQERAGRFAFASYLLGVQGAASAFGQGTPTGALPDRYAPQPAYSRTPLGAPAGERKMLAGIPIRNFEHGMVAVNPGPNDADIDVGPGYVAPDGQPVSHLRLNPLDAAILVHTGE
jgi:hypothetical protein